MAGCLVRSRVLVQAASQTAPRPVKRWAQDSSSVTADRTEVREDPVIADRTEAREDAVPAGAEMSAPSATGPGPASVCAASTQRAAPSAASAWA